MNSKTRITVEQTQLQELIWCLFFCLFFLKSRKLACVTKPEWNSSKSSVGSPTARNVSNELALTLYDLAGRSVVTGRFCLRRGILRIRVWLLHQLQGLVHAGRRQLPVDVPVAATQQVAVGGPQIPVKKGIYEGIDEGVGVTQPQQCPFQPQWNAAAFHAADERPGSGDQEEGQPAEGEGTYHDAQRGCCLLLPFKDGLVLPLAPLMVLARLEEAGHSGAALLLHLTLELQSGRHTVQALVLFLELFLLFLLHLGSLHTAGFFWHGGMRNRRCCRGAVLSLAGESRDGVLGRAELRRPVDPVVHDKHDWHGDVEGHRRGVDRVAKVLANEADSAIVDILCPTKERREGDGSWQQPHREDHLGHAAAILPDGICQWICNTQVPVQRNMFKAVNNESRNKAETLTSQHSTWPLKQDV